MSTLTIVVLLALGISTLVLTLYVSFVLPKRVEEEIRGSLRVFSTAIELRFASHRGLTDRVVVLCRAVGRQMGLSKRQLLDLESAAHLRDIGLCVVSYRAINHSPSNVPDDRAELYDRHPEISATMLELVPSLRRIAPIVRGHHASEVVDAQQAFIPVRASLPVESLILDVVTSYTWAERRQGDLIARELLRDGRGTIYDEEVVDAFLRVLTSGRVRSVPEIASVR